jgi:hypothetical protein
MMPTELFVSSALSQPSADTTRTSVTFKSPSLDTLPPGVLSNPYAPKLLVYLASAERRASLLVVVGILAFLLEAVESLAFLLEAVDILASLLVAVDNLAFLLAVAGSLACPLALA